MSAIAATVSGPPRETHHVLVGTWDTCAMRQICRYVGLAQLTTRSSSHDRTVRISPIQYVARLGNMRDLAHGDQVLSRGQWYNFFSLSAQGSWATKTCQIVISFFTDAEPLQDLETDAGDGQCVDCNLHGRKKGNIGPVSLDDI